MNGVRTIFRRKGYLLTALAAAVLLAASSGTALAQVTDHGSGNEHGDEGDSATYTVNVKGFIPVPWAKVAYGDPDRVTVPVDC